ncbi:putative reverse transcriptase domain-containing protein [Tanacetum coccineum]
MSDVAAIGGGYMAMAAHTIVTIAGPNGVGKFTFGKLYEKIGFNKEVISKGRFSETGNDVYSQGLVMASRGISLASCEVKVEMRREPIVRHIAIKNRSATEEFNANLLDFRLAKAGPTGDRTHMSTQVMGTHGYASPEYIATGRLTAKRCIQLCGIAEKVRFPKLLHVDGGPFKNNEVFSLEICFYLPLNSPRCCTRKAKKDLLLFTFILFLVLALFSTLKTDLPLHQLQADVTLKRMGIWLCGVCFKTHTLRAKCRHGADFVSPPDIGDGFVRFVLYDLTKPLVPSCSQLDLVDGLLHDQHDGFTLSLLDSLFSKGLRTVKSIPPKCRLGFSRVLKGALDKVVCKPDDISCWVSLLVLPLCLLKTFCPKSNLECKSANKRQRQEESITNAIPSWGVPGGSLQLVRETLAESGPPMLDLDGEDLDLTEQNLKQCKRKICDGHYTAAVRVLSSSGVAPYNVATLQELKTKHPFMSAPSLPDSHIDHHPLIASQDVVLDKIKSFPQGTSCGRDGLRAQHLMHCLSGATVAISDDLVSSITQVVNLFLKGKCPTVLGGYIASAPLTPLVKPGGGIRPIAVGTIWRCLVSKVSATMIGHYLDGYLDGLQFGVGVSGGGEAILHTVNRLVEDRGDDVGLSMLLVDFQNAFNLVDRTVMLEEVRLRCPAISRWVEFCYSSCQIVTTDGATHCGLPRGATGACAGVSKLYFAMRTCPPRVFESAQLSFDMALRSALERIVTASGSGFGDWQWRLATLPFAFGGLGIYSAGDVLNYAFIASRLQSATLQTKLLRDVGIVAPGSTFDDALCVFNNAMEIDFLSNPSEVAAPKLMKKMADIYFTRVTKDAESSYSLSPRQMALWQSQKEDHTSDWLRVVPISGLGQTMNGKTYRSVLCYRLGVPLFSVSKPCSACSRVFIEDIYGDHAISCAGIIGIKHRHNMVRDTLVDICFRSGISAGEVDIGLDGGHDKKLRPADMLLYSWDGGLDVCVDLTGSSPLTQTGMSDFAPGRAVTDAAQRKRGKYMTKCADIGYGFLPFSFSSFGELEKDAVTLLKRVRNFSMAQDIGARAASHIFNRIGFSIAKGERAQIVSPLPLICCKFYYYNEVMI